MNFLEPMLRETMEVGEARGKIKNARAYVLKVLKRQNIAVSEEQQATIIECKDLNQLELRHDLAITCKSANEVFSKSKPSS